MSFIGRDIIGKHFKSLGSKVKVMLKYSIYTCSFGVKGLNRALSVSDFLKYSVHSGCCWNRVTTDSWKQGKQGEWWKKIPCMEKSGNLKKIRKSGKNQGISNLMLKSWLAGVRWSKIAQFLHYFHQNFPGGGPQTPVSILDWSYHWFRHDTGHDIKSCMI